MARPRVSVNCLSERTKMKYSKSQLEEREAQEKQLTNNLSNSEIEDIVYKKIKGKRNKNLYIAFKKVLERLNLFTSIDSVTLSNLISTLESIENTKKLKAKALEFNDVEGYVKLEKLFISQSKFIQETYKALNISVDTRNKLQELTSAGELNNNEINDDMMNKLLEIVGGDE